MEKKIKQTKNIQMCSKPLWKKDDCAKNTKHRLHSLNDDNDTASADGLKWDDGFSSSIAILPDTYSNFDATLVHVLNFVQYVQITRDSTP